MSLRAHRRGAANARQQVITEYGTDLFGATTALAFQDQGARGMSGRSGTAYADRHSGRDFHGLAAPLQSFTGAAGVGVVRQTYKDTPPEIDNGYAVGPYADPARAIFAERMRTRR